MKGERGKAKGERGKEAWIQRLAVEGYGLFYDRHEWRFEPGLNIIYGANETGKSTLQRALLDALYTDPFSTARIYRERCAWNHPHGWQLELELQFGDSKIVLWKHLPVDTKSNRQRARLYLSDECYEDKEAMRQWNEIWSLPEAVYLATGCVRQRELHILLEEKGVNALKQSLHASALAADLKGIYRQLEEQSKQITGKSQGELVRLNARIAELQARLQSAHQRFQQREANQKRLEESVAQVAELESLLQQKEHLLTTWREALEKQAQLEEIRNREAELSHRLQELERLNYRLELISEELRRYEAFTSLPEDLPEQCARLLERLSSLESAQQKREEERHALLAMKERKSGRRKAGIGFLVIGFALLLAVFPLSQVHPLLPWIAGVGGGIALLLGIWLILTSTLPHFHTSTLPHSHPPIPEEYALIETHIRAWLQQAGIEQNQSTPERLESSLQSLLQQWQKYQKLVRDQQTILSERQGLLAGGDAEEWKRESHELASRRRALEADLNSQATRAVLGEPPLRFVLLEQEVQGLRSQMEGANRERLRLEGQLQEQSRALSQGEEPETLQLELDRLTHRHNQLQRKAQLYTLTKSLLEEAEKAFIEDLQTHLVPPVNRYLRAITGERYSEVQMEGDLSLRVYHPARGEWLPVELNEPAWSVGTFDQLFFAARLGLLEALSGSCRVPLLLDDPFVHYDPVRLQYALNTLLELSRDTQILLFTCRNLPVNSAVHVIEMEAK